MKYDDFFFGDVVLENDRARLEPLKPEHFEKLLPIALNLEIWEFTSATVTDEKSFQKYFTQALSEKSEKASYPFAIFDIQANQYAGCTRYANIFFEHKRLEIGWTWYHPPLQRTGLNKNCKHLLLSYAFDVLQLNRVELKTSGTNVKSQGAMLKIGAVKEGTLRRHMISERGMLRDSVYFSFIREEWEETKQNYFAEFL